MFLKRNLRFLCEALDCLRFTFASMLPRTELLRIRVPSFGCLQATQLEEKQVQKEVGQNSGGG
jgi:hypothetical protein